MIITGSIEEVRFANEENGYHILVLRVEGENVITVGTFPPVTEGETLKVSGEFVVHPRFGRQFKSERAERITPTTVESIMRFLSSGIIKGLGPKTAEAILDKYGNNALEVMENRPHLLGKIKGVSQAKAQRFCEEYKKHTASQNAIMFLQDKGISINMALKIFKAYGQQTKEAVLANPYRLIEDIDGIGFITADRIAKSVGIEETSEFRLRAGIICSLKDSGEREGNTFLFRDELVSEAAARLNLRDESLNLLEKEIDNLIVANKLKVMEIETVNVADSGDNLVAGIISDGDYSAIEAACEHDSGSGDFGENNAELFNDQNYNAAENSQDKSKEATGHKEAESLSQNIANNLFQKRKDITGKSRTAVFLRAAFNAEKSAAVRLVNLKKNFSVHCDKDDIEKDIDEYKSIYGIDLNDEQRTAVLTAFESGVSVITGSPGTGKTTIIKCLLYLFEKRKQSFSLMAPTGRAAKRINESTDKEATTIHRALHLPVFGDEMPTQILTDNVIVDEVSMMDIYLFATLLKCIRDGTRLVMLGDKDQLPSVGAGNILADLLQKCEVVSLKKIYRQAEKSLIIKNAHKINSGQMPKLDAVDADFFFIPREGAENIAKAIVELVSTRLPGYLKSESGKIQVLCPMKNGAAGTKNLNELLSSALNKGFGDTLLAGGCTFKAGDKVMQTSNNYSQSWTRGGEEGEGVFNGDMGVVESVSASARQLTVMFEDGRRAHYSENIDELTLAYAITVHKSQGSEFEAVVMPVFPGSPAILTRNLLYTAVTRAKRLIALVGDTYGIKRMVENNYIAKRNSALNYFIDQAEKDYSKLFGIT